MQRRKKQLALLGISFYMISMTLYGCSSTSESDTTTTQTTAATLVSRETASTLQSAVESDTDTEPKTISYEDEDLDSTWDESNTTTITCSGSSASIDGEGAAASGSTITITTGGTYLLKGSLDDGQIVIDAGKEDVIHLILDGISVTNSTSAAINGIQSEKVIITLADGSTNELTDGTTYQYEDTAQDEPNAALFSKDDLVINGSGSLKVTGNYQDGIRSKDDLTIISGTLDVTAKEDGIKGKDSVVIKDAALTVTSEADGIKASNDTDTEKGYIAIEGGTYKITAGNDGIQAETILQISGGTFHIETGGTSANASTKENGDINEGWGQWGKGQRGQTGSEETTAKMQVTSTASQITETGETSNEATNQISNETSNETEVTSTETSTSAKGLKGLAAIFITAGTFEIDSSDDSIHSNGDIAITDGTINLSSGDDGIHADSNLAISGGTLDIAKSYEGLEGLTVDISGGTIKLTASDDGINSAGGNDSSSLEGRPGANSFATNGDAYIRISDGTVYVNAEGDGLDSNGSLFINGGTVLVCGPVSTGNGALDYDGTGEITGGTLIATGSTGMAQSLTDNSTQANILVYYDELQASGTLINLSDENNTSLFSFAPGKDYQSVLISTPGLETGSSYTLSGGGSADGEETNGYYESGTYTGGTTVEEFTLEDICTTIGSGGQQSMGGMRGKGGMNKDNMAQ